jgi:hypothetical protein
MAEAFKILASGSASAAADLYTVPAATQAIVRQVTLVPTAGATRVAQLLVAGRAFTDTIELLSGEWCEWEGSIAMDTGKKVSLAQVAGTWDYVVAGLEIT